MLSCRALFTAPIVALSLLSAPATASEPKTIQIRVVGAPRFEVVYHRALTNMTGGAIAGVLGQAIQAGIEADMDREKRKALEPHLQPQVWKDVFVHTMNESLRAKGYEPTWIDAKEDATSEAAVHVVLFPETYGFRMVDTNTALVSSYVEFELAYSAQKIDVRKKPPKEAVYLTEKEQIPFEELAKDPAALSARVESVLAQAARRAVNKIVYNVK